MKTKFSENIKMLRKKQHITQEQLAEAMGVTAGAIYKWEQELSTPDICMIMELASFFGISVDALVGYEACANDKERILQSLKQIRLAKTYENSWNEIESWIRRYPNDFAIVYNSGILYNLAGIETENKRLLSRSIVLLQHACRLLPQNTDPEISETSICRDIAIAYLSMGKSDEGIQQLKDHNSCGINDDILGLELATNAARRDEALPYLSRALLKSTANLYRIVFGFLNLFFAQEDFSASIQIIQWMDTYLEGLKTDKGPSYLDKDIVCLLALGAAVYSKIGQMDEAKNYLQKAMRIALVFDSNPDYTSRNIRYCETQEFHTAYDNLGTTAMDTILHTLQDGADSPEEPILKLWEEICHEA